MAMICQNPDSTGFVNPRSGLTRTHLLLQRRCRWGRLQGRREGNVGYRLGELDRYPRLQRAKVGRRSRPVVAPNGYPGLRPTSGRVEADCAFNLAR